MYPTKNGSSKIYGKKSIKYLKLCGQLNPCHVTGIFLYLQKTSGNLRLSGVFRRYKKKPVTWNRLYECILKPNQNHCNYEWKRNQVDLQIADI